MKMRKGKPHGGRQGTDIMSSAKRSEVMSHIRGRDTGPELVLRKALWHRGLRYRLKNSLPGRPDLVFRGAKVAVFVDGCFWHRCPQHATKPKNNAAFWDEKLSRNVERDAEVNRCLRELGWTVVRLWEHQVKDDLAGCERAVVDALGQMTDAVRRSRPKQRKRAG